MIVWFLTLSFEMIMFPAVRGWTHLMVSSLCARVLRDQVGDLVTLTVCGASDAPCYTKS